MTGGGASGLGARGSPSRVGASARAAAGGGMASTALEIIAFTVSISGWVLVSSTLPTDYWKVSTIDGTVITTATYFANLWKMCVTDSTGVANCKDFPSMLALDGLHPFGPPSPFLPLAGFPGWRVLLGTPGREAGPRSAPGEGLRYPLSDGAPSEPGNSWWGRIGSFQAVGERQGYSRVCLGLLGRRSLPPHHQNPILIQMTPLRSMNDGHEIPLAGSLSLCRARH